MLSFAHRPNLKNDGAKILIFYDFRNFLIITLKWMPIGAKGPHNHLVSANYPYLELEDE